MRHTVVDDLPTDSSVAAATGMPVAQLQRGHSVIYNPGPGTYLEYVRSDAGLWFPLGDVTVPPPFAPYQDFYSDYPNAFVTANENFTGTADEAVVLRGFNALHNSYQDDWPQSRWTKFATEPVSVVSADRGFDVVRLVMRWAAFEPTKGTINATQWGRLLTQIERIKAAGFKIILDPIHSTAANYGSGSNHDGTRIPSWLPQISTTPKDLIRDLTSDATVAFTEGPNHACFWLRYVCQAFADDRDVIAIDLVNEPGLAGTGAGYVNMSQLLQFYRDTIQYLRPDGVNEDSDVTKGKILGIESINGQATWASTNHPLSGASGDSGRRIDWASDFPASVRPNVVVMDHNYYGGGGGSHGTVGDSSRNGWSTSGFKDGLSTDDIAAGTDTDYWNENTTQLEQHVDQLLYWLVEPELPLFYGELGIGGVRGNKGAYIDAMRDALLARGIGWTVWNIYSGDVSGQSYHGMNLVKASTQNWDTTMTQAWLEES